MANKKTKNSHLLIEMFGWYGAVAIVSAYALVSYQLLAAGSLTYQLLNLTGSVGILISAYSKRDFQPVFLNAVWIIIATTAIASILFH